MKRFAIAITLSCVLSGAVIAGEVPMVVPAPPPSAATLATTGQIPSVPIEIPSVGAADQLSDDVLSAVLTLFGLLS